MNSIYHQPVAVAPILTAASAEDKVVKLSCVSAIIALDVCYLLIQ